MAENKIHEMMRRGLEQAKADDAVPLEEAFDQLEHLAKMDMK